MEQIARERERELLRIENFLHDNFDQVEYHRASDTFSLDYPSVFYSRIMAGENSKDYERAVRMEAREILNDSPNF